MTARPLDGLRVFDCSGGAAGQQAAGLLGDYGAEVVLVEPAAGALTRVHEPAAASVYNRNKKSITCDVSDPAEVTQLLDISRWADVLVTDWRRTDAEDRGLSPDAFRKHNPHLVQCWISGFGEGDPDNELPGYEALVHALLGTMAVQAGHREGPIFQGLPFATTGAAQLAVVGILAALYKRMDDGVGRVVETSLKDGAMAFHAMLWGESDAAIARGTMRITGKQLAGGTTQRLVTRSFLCADDAYVGVHTGALGAFGRLMEVLGLDDRIPPSKTGLDIGQPLMPEQAELLQREIYGIFRSQPSHYWVARLMQADVCCVEHLPPTGVFDQDQARHNQMVVAVQDPRLGLVEQVAPGIRFDDAPPIQPSPAPAVGADSGLRSRFANEPPSNWSKSLPSDRAPDMAPLLEGVKVLDLGAYYAGPYSSRLLADFGADVIKVETLGGDQLRGLERPFFAAQAGKRSLSVNLKSDAIAPLMGRMLAWADIVHHNLRPGAAERLGLDVEQVRKVNPGLIYLYAPGWGATGPHRLRQSFAPMLSGFVGVTYEAAGEYNEPLPSCGNEDPGNGFLGGIALLAALLHKRRTGHALACENPQLNAAMGMVEHIVRTQAGEVVGARRLDVLQTGFDALDSLYETADGWICLVARRDDEIGHLETVIGTSILADERFSSPALRQENRDALADLVRTWTLSRSTGEALSTLRNAGVAAVVPVGEEGMRDVFYDDAQRRLGRVAEVRHSSLGAVREFAKLLRISDAAIVPHRLAPGLGEHTDEILAQFEVGAEQIAEFRRNGDVR